MSEFELRFAEIDISENRNCANLYNDPRLNGWYSIDLLTEEETTSYIDTVVRFIMPSPIKLYGDVLRNFTQEERKAGIHRMLIGKDLQEEVKQLLDLDNVTAQNLDLLTKDEITEILNRMEKIIVLEFNKIPYLHIRTKLGDLTDYTNDIIKYILGFPDYLKILNNVLNEKISIADATKESQNIIYNELLSSRTE